MSTVEEGAPARPARVSRRAARIDPGQFFDVVTHLAHRQVASMHRFTLLGWAWPVVRQLAQLAVFVFVFSTILDLGIDNFPVFVFSGLTETDSSGQVKGDLAESWTASDDQKVWTFKLKPGSYRFSARVESA